MDTLQFIALFTLVSAVYFRITAIYRAVRQDDDSAKGMSLFSIFLFSVAFSILISSVIFP